MNRKMFLVPLVAAGLAGCAFEESVVIDMTGVAGDGLSVTTAYVMPTNVPLGTNGGMEDYLAEGGFWKYRILQQKTLNGGLVSETLGAMVYNTTTQRWHLTYGGSTPVLTYDSAEGRHTDCTLVGCIPKYEFYLFDRSTSTSQYGTFGYARNASTTDIDMHSYFVTGMETLTADVPDMIGAVYYGDFALTMTDGLGGSREATGGTIRVLANITSGSGSLTFQTSQAATFTDIPDTYYISGNATVAGNSFSSAAFTGIYNGSVSFDSGTMGGVFFGPYAEEIAGTFSQTSSDVSYSSHQVVGGFWAAK